MLYTKSFGTASWYSRQHQRLNSMTDMGSSFELTLTPYVGLIVWPAVINETKSQAH